VPLSRVPVLLFSVEILCAQLGHRHRSEILVSLLVDFAFADRRFSFPAWGVSCRADLASSCLHLVDRSVSSCVKRTAVGRPAFLARAFFLSLVALVFRSASVHAQALIL
jgi:hypothetical protein